MGSLTSLDSDSEEYFDDTDEEQENPSIFGLCEIPPRQLIMGLMSSTFWSYCKNESLEVIAIRHEANSLYEESLRLEKNMEEPLNIMEELFNTREKLIKNLEKLLKEKEMLFTETDEKEDLVKEIEELVKEIEELVKEIEELVKKNEGLAKEKVELAKKIDLRKTRDRLWMYSLL